MGIFWDRFFRATAACLAAVVSPPLFASELEFFEKEVRPVLAEHCFGCHGAEKQQAGLRLDHISTILSGGDNGPAVVPGNPAESRLLRGISYEDVDFQMPPKGKLPDTAIEALRQWVKDGAVWPEEPLPAARGKAEAFNLEKRAAEHWAWQPIGNPAPPEVQREEWPRTDIDRFILAKLEEANLAPAPEADRAVLFRRLHFDLTGLPPTPEDIEQFLNDTEPSAYERAVDRLLASPHFGEAWGRHWLDVTRYAETYGLEQDFPVKHAWQYRDYVIRAFNADVPYDQLVREHIAGDLLPEPRRHPELGFNESIIGTGFWHMHQAQHAPVDVQLDHANRIDNQIDVMSKAFLGMTVACARCHDHKFDAISTADYYALSGYLRSSRRQEAMLDPLGQIRGKSEELAGLYVEGGDALESLVSRAKGDPLTLTLSPRRGNQSGAGAPCGELTAIPPAESDASAEKAVDGDQDAPPVLAPPVESVLYEDFEGGFGDWFAHGPAFGDGVTGTRDWMRTAQGVQLLPAGVAHSGRLSGKLRGNLRTPTFTLEHDRVQFLAAGRGGQLRLVIENYAIREFHPLLFSGTLIDVNHGDDFRWVEMAADVDKYRGCRAYIELIDDGDGYIAVDEIRFSDVPLRQVEPAVKRDVDLRRAAHYWLDGTATDDERAALNTALADLDQWPAGITQDLQRVTTAMNAADAALPAPMRVLALADGNGFDSAVFVRGDYKNKGEIAPRRFLTAVAGTDQPPVGEGTSGRLDLAAHVASPENPLTARVMANRVWHHLFGRGIVATVDDFGVLGETPSHPELLDHLSRRFIENDWSVKSLIREVVTSSSYRMSSAPNNPAAERVDPANTLVHRMNIRRLPAESIRDSVLAVSGTLDRTMFGESVPAYVSPFMGDYRMPKESGPMDGAGRRSVYLEVRRNFLLPSLLAFDFPEPDTTHGRRNTSNVPSQALIMMNDPFVRAQAEAWGKRMAERGDDAFDARLNRAFLSALGRRPSEAERERGAAYFADGAEARGLPVADAQRSAEVWADYCHVLFMLKEFIYLR